ncbi:MAG: signal peptide peptidase SppA [Gloeobacterales cyanobacterium]
MRDFLKYTLATFVGLLLFIGAGVIGLAILLFALGSSDSGPKVADKSVLVLDLSTNITDANPTPSANQVLRGALSGDRSDSISLRNVLQSIEQATQDKRIVGLYLRGDMAGTTQGSAVLKEVRGALENFRKAGKPIYAYGMNWEEREYYLGSVANKVMLNPFGNLEMNGLRSEMVFLAGALKKYGVGVQVTRVGKYKAAVEPFLLTKMSPESREDTQKLLNDVWDYYLTSVSKDRKLTPKDFQTIASDPTLQGILTPDKALKLKLIDQVAYSDEVIQELKELTGSKEKDHTFRQVSLTDYATVLDPARKSNNQVAVAYAEGEIVDGQGRDGQVGGDSFAQELRDLRLDNNVKAVVLRVNSPGGSATASEVIQRELVLTRKVKPVVVSMGSVAASGGYWISAYADKIFAQPNTITGSIGVFGQLFNIQKLANNNGITWDTVKTSPYADSQTISRPKTPQELAVVQTSVDRIYNVFLTKVAEGRKLSKPSVTEIAQGRVWSGIRAKQIGLVDEMGGLEDAIQDAVKRAKLGDDWQVEDYPRAESFETWLLEKFSPPAKDANTKLDPLTAQVQIFQKELNALKAMNDPMGVYARLPYDLKID